MIEFETYYTQNKRSSSLTLLIYSLGIYAAFFQNKNVISSVEKSIVEVSLMKSTYVDIRISLTRKITS